MKTLTTLLLCILQSHAAYITHYTANEPFCYSNKAVIRTFNSDGHRKQLVVNVDTLHTSTQLVVRTLGHPCGSSRYKRLLDQASAAPYPLTNDGFTHQHDGITLTTDLCPSSKAGFEYRLYQTLIDRFKSPAPVTLFISGRWIAHHEEALAQLRRWDQEKKLAITWGNHTDTHPYHPGKTLEHNFALSEGYHLKSNTLKLEQALLERGIVPSIFFRFPGLVSDQKAMQTIHDLGLITIGSDTWIAKGQKVKEGSIILLHGNKNEAKGVKVFLEMLDKGKIQKIDPLSKVLP